MVATNSWLQFKEIMEEVFDMEHMRYLGYSGLSEKVFSLKNILEVSWIMKTNEFSRDILKICSVHAYLWALQKNINQSQVVFSHFKCQLIQYLVSKMGWNTDEYEWSVGEISGGNRSISSKTRVSQNK